MPAQRIRRIQDAIHGLMEFRGMETTVIELLSTAELQRMRRIRQLGLAYQVFPAAEHSRLVHAIGAAYLANRFVRHLADTTEEVLEAALRPDEEVRRDIAVAAIVHDIGHGPLSHAWEEVMVGYDRQAWASSLGVEHLKERRDIKWHELVGQGLLAWPEGELRQALEAHDSGTSERIAQLLDGEYYIPYLPRLLNSDIDVDRCDYLIRDALMTGVAYGRYDVDWLISTASVGVFPDSNELVFGFDAAKAPRVMEQLLVARRALYDTVYQHKTVRAAEGMVVRLFERLRALAKDGSYPEGDNPVVAAYQPVLAGDALSCEQVLALDDYSLIVFIGEIARNAADPTAQELARRLLGRSLFKLVPVREADLVTFMEGDSDRQRLLRCIAPHVPGCDPQYFYYQDSREFWRWSDAKSKRAYVVEQRPGRLGRARLARNETELEALDMGQRGRRLRLFAPRAALADLVALIES